MRGSTLVIIATSVLVVGSATYGTSQTRKSQVVNIDAMRALWSAIKNQLMTAPNAEEYFRLNFKHADVPPLVGTLISATPSQQPNTLVLGLSDASTPEVTVHLMTRNGQDDHLNGPLMLGSQVQFQGIPVAFTQNPFMLTFDAIISSVSPIRSRAGAPAPSSVARGREGGVTVHKPCRAGSMTGSIGVAV